MPKKWIEVASSPEFNALNSGQQEAARQQYWRDVVEPNVPAEHRQTARQQFDADTVPTVAHESPGLDIEIRGGTPESQVAQQPQQAPAQADNPSLFRSDSDFREKAGLGATDMLVAAAKDMFGGNPGQYLADQYNEEHGLSAQINGGAKVVQGPDGQPMVRLPDGSTYSLNDKGVDSQDVANVAGNVAAFYLPASWAGRAGQARNLGLLGRMGMQGGAAAATDVGIQAAANNGQVDMGHAAMVGAGGAGGELAGAGLRAIGSNAAKVANPIRQQAIEVAKRNNIPLHISQISESLPVKTLASAAKYLPFSGAGKAAARQQGAFNRSVARTFGADAEVLTDDVMAGARRNLSHQFEDIYNRNDIPLDPESLTRLSGIVNTTGRRLTKDQAEVVANQFDDIIGELNQSGVLTGQKYQALRTQIMKAEGPDKVGQAVAELRKELDGVAAQAVGPNDSAALKTLRSQWANLRTTQKALGQVEGAKGNVRPSALWPLVRNGSTKEMRDLGRLGQVLLKDPIPDSGTGARLMAYGGLGAGAGTGALPQIAGLIGAGATAGRALNSPTLARLMLGAQAATPSTANALARLTPAAGALVVSEKKRGNDKRKGK